MKTCKRCFQKFYEEDVLDVSLETELAEIFIEDIGIVDINDLCPECREEFVVRNLLVFEEE